jgi:hypothetical protein
VFTQTKIAQNTLIYAVYNAHHFALVLHTIRWESCKELNTSEDEEGKEGTERKKENEDETVTRGSAKMGRFDENATFINSLRTIPAHHTISYKTIRSDAILYYSNLLYSTLIYSTLLLSTLLLQALSEGGEAAAVVVAAAGE